MPKRASHAARGLLGQRFAMRLNHQPPGATSKKRINGRRPAAVLDQGIAINGQLRVKLLGLSLLPIEVRLLISSKDLAAAVGLDWWNADPARGSGARKRRGQGR
jgi:hypothetical protein